MTERTLKALLALLIFFLLDTTRPLAYSLTTEFTFLGIILICLNYPLKISLILAAVFGYLKDVSGMNTGNLNLFEFTIMAVSIHYFLRNFHGKAVKIFIFFGALIVHTVINNFYIAKTTYFFSFLFFIHSSIIFLLINHLFARWINCEPGNKDVV
jgi:hypothetical protein